MTFLKVVQEVRVQHSHLGKSVEQREESVPRPGASWMCLRRPVWWSGVRDRQSGDDELGDQGHLPVPALAAPCCCPSCPFNEVQETVQARQVPWQR